MRPSRKRFRFLVTPSDRQLSAIGLVAVQWSAFEMLVTVMVHALTREDSAERKQFDQTRNMKTRIATCESLIDVQIREPFRSRLLDIIRRSKDVQNQRDKIIHNQWAGDAKSTPDNPLANAVTNISPPHHPFKWKLTYGKIHGVAVEIDDLMGEVIDLAAHATGHPPNFTLPDALKRISRKQYRDL